MSQPITYIIVRSYFMADFILDGLAGREDVVVVQHTPAKGLIASMARGFRMMTGNRKGLFSKLLFTDDFRRILPQVRKCDRVVFWGVENYKYVMMMARELPCRTRISFLWNPLRSVTSSTLKSNRYKKGMKAMGVDVCSFDEADCKALGCRHVPQVHRRIDLPDRSKTPKAFFVGFEKGREESLYRLASVLESLGVDSDIKVIRSKHHRQLSAKRERFMTDIPVGYDEILKRISMSTCMIDFVQPGQSGISLRTLEALFYGKKLITNNERVLNMPFYHPSRVFVFNPDLKETGQKLKEFLEKPYQPTPDSILATYEIENWFDNLLKHAENE